MSRWRIAASFVLVVVASVLIVWLNDFRTDRAIKRANAAVLVSASALAKAEANAEVNRTQDAVRAELVSLFCSEIESIKERIRATVRAASRDDFGDSLRNINPDISDVQIDALWQRAKAQEQEVRERFAARDCATVPGG